MASITLSVVAPDRSVVDETVASVLLPGREGYLGVMAGHEPFVVALRAGFLEFIDEKNQRQLLAIGGGFAEITGTRVTVLADSAEFAHEISLQEAERHLEEARRALRGESSTIGSEEAAHEIDRAMTRIRAAKAP